MWFKLEHLEHAGGIALRISELDSRVAFSFILTELDMEVLSEALKQELARLSRERDSDD